MNTNHMAFSPLHDALIPVSREERDFYNAMRSPMRNAPKAATTPDKPTTTHVGGSYSGADEEAAQKAFAESLRKATEEKKGKATK